MVLVVPFSATWFGELAAKNSVLLIAPSLERNETRSEQLDAATAVLSRDHRRQLRRRP